MSLQLVAIPFGVGFLFDISSYFFDTDITIRTSVDSMETLDEIIENNDTLGFKSKRDFLNFQEQGSFLFQLKKGRVEARFVGNYNPQDIETFINAINQDFKKITNANKTDFTVVEEKTKSFKVSSFLKDETIINSILEENFLGYSSKNDLKRFQNIGSIVLKKTNEDTLDFIFIGDYDEEEARNYVKNISDEYTLVIQEQTYLKVLEKIEKENLTLESEIIDNEDSIVLTLNID